MYDPTGNAKAKHESGVEFVEAEPPHHLVEVVHRWVSLRTVDLLEADYRFHALPDACTYIIFSQRDPAVCGVTRLRATSEELNLGRQFHFTNIRFLPGVWVGEAATGIIDSHYPGDLPLIDYAARLHGLDLGTQVPILIELVDRLVDLGVVSPNPTTSRIFGRIDEIHSVGDMARVAHLSPRQLQRVLSRALGLSPHDFLKILRLQQTLRHSDSSAYADQSHFIRSFRSATGYTPGEFARRYDV